MISSLKAVQDYKKCWADQGIGLGIENAEKALTCTEDDGCAVIWVKDVCRVHSLL